MRTYIDSMQAKMYLLLEVMLLIAQKEKDAETNAKSIRFATQFGSSSLSIPGVTNLDDSLIHPKEGPIPIPISAVNIDPPP